MKKTFLSFFCGFAFFALLGATLTFSPDITVPTTLGVGTNTITSSGGSNSQLLWNGNALAGASSLSAFNAPVQCYDFLATTVPNGFLSALTGTGTAGAVFGTQGHFGSWGLTTQNGTTGGSAITSQAGNVGVAGGRTFALYTKFQTPAALSDGTDTYTLFIGGSDRTTVVAPQYGMFITYNSATNSGNWVLWCSDGTYASSNATTGPAISTWYDLVISCNSAGTLVTYYLSTDSGVTWTTLGTVNSHVPDGPPTGGAETFGPYAGILKSAGTNNRVLTIDKICWGYFN